MSRFHHFCRHTSRPVPLQGNSPRMYYFLESDAVQCQYPVSAFFSFFHRIKSIFHKTEAILLQTSGKQFHPSYYQWNLFHNALEFRIRKTLPLPRYHYQKVLLLIVPVFPRKTQGLFPKPVLLLNLPLFPLK